MLTVTRLLLQHKPPGALYLYAPPPGLPAYRVRNELQQLVGVRLVWYNRLASVREYHARHWVGCYWGRTRVGTEIPAKSICYVYYLALVRLALKACTERALVLPLY